MREELDWNAWERISRLGLIEAPSPLTPLPTLAADLGLRSLWVKRDDELTALRGGTKPRKLDYLLAREPYRGAPRWQSLGAIGSGHLVALGAAAAELGRHLVAHCFPQPRTSHATANAALLCSLPVTLAPHRSRLAVGLRHPALLFAASSGGIPIVPPGATAPFALLGLVRAAFELAEQVRAGAAPPPDAVYVALGSGGTAAGLAVGFALAGLATRIHAVAAVEPWLSRSRRLERLQLELLALLHSEGVVGASVVPVPVCVDRGELGRGYADPTLGAEEACSALAGCGIPLEPAYTGKAFAALLAAAPRHRNEHVLFWETARTTGHDPPGTPTPAALHLLIGPEQARARRVRRRALMVGSCASAAALVATHRLGDYRGETRVGRILSDREAAILKAAARVVTPLAEVARPTPEELVGNVERYLGTLSPLLRRRVRFAIAAFEQATALTLELDRFTRLARAAQEAYLRDLAERGGKAGQMVRAVRDLCLLAFYQAPERFEDLGYEGPLASSEGAPVAPQGDPLRAPRGRLPRSART